MPKFLKIHIAKAENVVLVMRYHFNNIKELFEKLLWIIINYLLG